MPGAGTVVHNPHTGETITFLETVAETGGERFRMEIRVPGGREGMVGPEHFHPIQEERFEVRSGTARFRLDGREFDAGAGEEVVVPPRGVHIFGNAGPGELVMVSTYTPGLRSTEVFFETFFGLAQEGKVGRGGRPDLLTTVRTMHNCRDYFVVVKPPPAVQRVAFPPLAALARIAGRGPRGG
jgi:mannose-6-phosphate isomerase-like protein (cupin superfamily)